MHWFLYRTFFLCYLFVGPPLPLGKLSQIPNNRRNDFGSLSSLLRMEFNRNHTTNCTIHTVTMCTMCICLRWNIGEKWIKMLDPLYHTAYMAPPYSAFSIEMGFFSYKFIVPFHSVCHSTWVSWTIFGFLSHRCEKAHISRDADLFDCTRTGSVLKFTFVSVFRELLKNHHHRKSCGTLSSC